MKFYRPVHYLIFVLLTSCGTQPEPGSGEVALQRLSGQTMGTTYSVVFVQPGEEWDATITADLQATLDSAMIALNNEVSNWEKNSTVVRFNGSEVGISVVEDHHFRANYELVKEVAEATEGAYEPTILPLTDYWGFGSGRERIEAGVDTAEVERRLALVDYTKISMEGDTFLRKAAPGIQLDLGGSAKGYGVDLMAKVLEKRGINHFLVEIGGEMFARGTKGKAPWAVGINLPEEGAAFNALARTMPLTDRAVATSGNYRNYYRVGAETYSHTLNPKTGFPERNALLSASVLAPDCATADAFATACMVLGPQEALDLINGEPELECYLLVRSADGKMEPLFSEGLNM